MCDLAATGYDPIVLIALGALGLAAVAIGVALLRRSRAALAVLLGLLIVGFALVPSVPASAACPPEPAPVPAATIGLIVTDTEFALTGAARSTTVDIENVSTETAYDVTLVGAPPAGVTFDPAPCAVLAPAGSCSIVVGIEAGAAPFFWEYDVAGSNTNAVADSIRGLGPTTLATISLVELTIPGDSSTFQLTNTGTRDARGIGLGIGDAGSSIASTTCGWVLAAGASCDITVRAEISFDATTLTISSLNGGTLVVDIVPF